MQHTSFKRMMAWLLAMVMIIGLIPANALTAFAADATQETIYVLAGGDFQEAGDHANSAANVTNILAQISQKYNTMDGFLFIGDYDCETHNDAAETAAGITSLMDTVDNAYTNINDANSILVQGNHDYKDSRIDATGGHDFEGYSVFVMNEDEYPDAGGTEKQATDLAAKLEAWLENKLAEGYDAPIFITSHLPLAFSPRTNVVGDGKYAKPIFDVINKAGEEGLNIIFMHGHDHAYGNDNYLGGEAIYLPKGDKINIAKLGSQTAWTEETLHFTYMNAGYVGYYNDWNYVTTEGSDKLTMTVFAITGSEVTVERYSANGKYNLKSEGRNGRYVRGSEASAESLGLAYNTTVYPSPQTITLRVSSNDAVGTIGTWVNAGLVEDVTTSGNQWVTINAATNGTAGTEATYEYVLDTNGIDAGSGNKYIIVARNAAYLLDAGNAVNITGSINGNTITLNTQKYEYYFTGSTSGLITRDGTNTLYQQNWGIHVGNESDSNLDMFVNNGSGYYRLYDGDGTARSLYWDGDSWTVTSSDHTNSNYTVRLFKYSKTNAGTAATPGSNGLYGYLDGELVYTVAPGTSREAAIAAVQQGIAVKYTTYEDYSNVQTLDDDNAEGMSWSLDAAYNGTASGDFAVTISYNGTVLGTAKVIVPTSTYYIAEGKGMYTVPMHTSADDAMAAVMAGVTVSSATDDQGANKATIDDEDVTWNWVDTYDNTDNGPYTVEILYNGTSLGTVEVKVDVKYTNEIKDWTNVGTTEAGYKYVLDTDGWDSGTDNMYIIVGDDEGKVLAADPSAVIDVTPNNDTIVLPSRANEYYFYRSSTGTYYIRNASGQYLYHYWYEMYLNNSRTQTWTITHNGNGNYTLLGADNNGNWRLNYDSANNDFRSVNSDVSVRLYKYAGQVAASTLYAHLEGNTVYAVEQGKSRTSALNIVKAGITGYISNNADGSNATELDDNDLDWEWLNTYKADVPGSYWVQISYQGKVLGTVEVQVEPSVVNNYPEYPDEGAVKVNKTATGIDFQSSGIAQIELSASGVPSKKGVDVIIMLDTSSSMTKYDVTGTTTKRATVMEQSLKDLINTLKTRGDDNEMLDIQVAIADFNGFNGYGGTSGTPYDRDEADHMNDTAMYPANGNNAQIFTGDRSLKEGAFVSVEDLTFEGLQVDNPTTGYKFHYDSGTNYDYAMDAIYQLATAKKLANGSEERDLYVIFMSDGAAMQWNYYHSQGASSLWNNWITGAWDADDLSETNLNCTTHKHYYNLTDTNGDGMLNEHWMANAIKGDPTQVYKVIRKTATLGTAVEGEANMYMVAGLGAKLFTISFDAQADDRVTEESMDKSIEALASAQTDSTKYYYKVTSATELTNAFKVIGTEIAYAANNARFVDQIGDDYNLQLKTSTYKVVKDGTEIEKTLAPVIEILTYDIYTKAEADEVPEGTEGDKVTKAMIGQRKGTSTLKEVIKFSDDGKKAYSSLIDVDKDGTYGVTVNADGTYTIADTDDNILGTDGVIYAKTFVYNTTPLGVAIEGVSIPTKIVAGGTTEGTTNMLPSETFYWKMGTVQTSELAMRYYVYLEGSMEGTKEGGSYPTNEYATLYYDNYLGNPCYKDTVSPVMAWKEANVSYAFYLVNENGEIIVNQTSGLTGSFANKIAVTNPVVYKTVLLNSEGNVEAIKVTDVENTILPLGYELYDSDAEYEVTINSNTTGSWKITSGKGKDVATTYVTQYDPNDASAYSNDQTHNTGGTDYTHTVVWFAVLWKVQALPDSVVVDYGLPVDIHVLGNDMFGEKGKLVGIGAYSDTLNLDGHDTALASGFATTYTGTYGTAKADAEKGTVRYTLNTSNGMQMQTYEKFAYAVNYTGSENAGYYYDTVTVIPATTIYYEESFVTLESYTWNGGWTKVEKTNDNWVWSQEGTTVDGTQDEDRPGKYSITDANNIYGFDNVNKGMTTYSMGSAMKADVNYDNYGLASFTFYGTGFDIISMTNNTTGTIYVDVYQNGQLLKDKSFIVDTYYGYHQVAGDADDDGTVEEGEMIWEVNPNAEDSIYQVPVMKVDGLPYGQYTAKITVFYSPAYDNVEGSTDYAFYLDAIRIYDPANDGAADGTTDTTIEDAYKADGEGWPSYIELRNKIIEAGSFDNVANDALTTDMEGLVFIDGDASVGDAQLSDYVNYGPNNEVYLAPGQRVAFILNTPANIDQVHIGFKSADGNPVTYTVTNIAKANNSETGVTAGDYYGAKTSTIDTTTDMYYDITGYKGNIIVISNTGNLYNTTGILSITNIKSTYTSNPNGTEKTGDSSTETVQTYSVRMLSAAEDTATEGNETTIYMTPAAATLALRAVNTMYLPEAFEPEQLEVGVNRDHVKEGDKVKVTVKTSDDVAYITVNGETVTKYRTNRRTGERTWTVTLKAEEAGELNIEVIAYDAEDLASDPVTETVTVEAKKDPKERAREIMKDLFGRFFG